MDITAERFTALQGRWRVAAGKQSDHRRAMQAKYNSDLWDIYALKSERDRAQRLAAAEDRALEALYALLDLTPAGRQWHYGPHCGFVRDSLTFAQAMDERPTLPADALAYGQTRRTVWYRVED